MDGRREIPIIGLAWSSIDDATKTLLRPLIDAGVLVTRRDPQTLEVTVTFTGRAVAWDSQSVALYLEENREFLAWRQKIHARSSLWDKGGRSPELLLSEEETTAAQRSRSEHASQLTAVEIAYLDESLKRQGGYRTPVPAGEFTRMFSSPIKTVEPPQPVWPSPPPQAPSQGPGEFTQMFQVPEPKRRPQQPVPPPVQAAPVLQQGPSGYAFGTSPSPPIPQQQPFPMQSSTLPSARARWHVGGIAAVAIGVAVLLIAGYFSLLRKNADLPKAAVPAIQKPDASLVDQAHAAVQNGAYDDAVKLLTQAIQAGQPVYAERAYAYRLSGNLDAAVADYQRAIQTGKADNQTYADQAFVLALKGDWSQSIQLLTDVIRLDPSNVNYYVSRGRAYIAAGNFKSALSDFDNALKRDPTSAAAQTGKADALKKLQLAVPSKEAAPRIYIQISSEVQRAQARHLQDALTDLGYTVPPFEIVGQKSPARNELRFIYAEDQAQAEKLAASLQKANFPVDVKQIAKRPTGDARFRHFELWFAKVTARSQPSPGSPAQQKTY